MSVEHIEFLVEEPSMEALLESLLPRLLGNISHSIHVTSNLLSKLPARLGGYSNYLPDTHRIVVILDRDSRDCRDLKGKMEEAARKAGLPTKTNPKNSGFIVVNRLAIEELEAWYFGDWEAVSKAYPRVSINIPTKSKYRDPDSIPGGTWEEFERILKRAGYFRGGLRKIEAARKIAPHFDPERNRSRSFRVFRDALRYFVGKG